MLYEKKIIIIKNNKNKFVNVCYIISHLNIISAIKAPHFKQLITFSDIETTESPPSLSKHFLPTQSRCIWLQYKPYKYQILIYQVTWILLNDRLMYWICYAINTNPLHRDTMQKPYHKHELIMVYCECYIMLLRLNDN